MTISALRHHQRREQPHRGGAVRIAHLAAPFHMRRGGVLEQVQIAYETWGELSPARDNVVLLFTGLSPTTHAASSPADPSPGWWEYMVGPGRPIDTERFHVICVNSLGGCFGSTGPACINPATGAPYRLSFPELTVEDIAASAHAALKAIGIERVRCVAGPSLGGMSALAYAMMFPNDVDNLVTLCAATQAKPFAIGIRSLQREIIRNDPAWRGGDYDPERGPVQGMRLARKLGLTSYRSPVEWAHRFGRGRVAGADDERKPFEVEFQVESYLEYQAGKFVDGFDANSYLYLSRAMDWFDAAEHGGGDPAAGLARIRAARTLVAGVETDILFPVEQQRDLADTLRRQGRDVRFHALPSLQGHDAFLVDEARFAPVMAEFFGELS